MTSNSNSGQKKMPSVSESFGNKNNAQSSGKPATRVMAWDGVVVKKPIQTSGVSAQRSAAAISSANSSQTISKTQSPTNNKQKIINPGLEFRPAQKPVSATRHNSASFDSSNQQSRSVSQPSVKVSTSQVTTSVAMEGIKVAPNQQQIRSQPSTEESYKSPESRYSENPSDSTLPESEDSIGGKKFNFPNLTMTIRGYGSELLTGLGLGKHSEDYEPEIQSQPEQFSGVKTPNSNHSSGNHTGGQANTELFNLSFYNGHDNAISSTIFPTSRPDDIYESDSRQSHGRYDAFDLDNFSGTTATFANSLNRVWKDHARLYPSFGTGVQAKITGYQERLPESSQITDYIIPAGHSDVHENSVLQQNQSYLFQKNSSVKRSRPVKNNAEEDKFIPFVGQQARKRIRPIPARNKLSVWQNLEILWNRSVKSMSGSRSGEILAAIGPILFSRMFAFSLISLLVLVFMGNLWMSTRSINQSSQASSQPQQVIIPPASQQANFGPQVPIVDTEGQNSDANQFFDPALISSQPASSLSTSSSKAVSKPR